MGRLVPAEGLSGALGLEDELAAPTVSEDLDRVARDPEKDPELLREALAALLVPATGSRVPPGEDPAPLGEVAEKPPLERRPAARLRHAELRVREDRVHVLHDDGHGLAVS